jgi:hypothetical protein
MHAPTLAGVLGMLLSVSVQADRFEHALAATLNTEYDSNAAMSAASSDAIWRVSLTPSYSLLRTSGADSWNARLGLSLERSSDPELSIGREDPTLTLNWSRQFPAGSFGITASHVEASTRVAELQDSGLVAADGSRIDQSLAANWSRALSDRRNLSLNLGHVGVSYRGGTLTDYATLSAGATLRQAWSERSEPYLRFSASHYAPETTGNSSDSFDLLAGVKLTGSDRLNLDLAGGWNLTEAQTSRSGWQGSLKLNYAMDERASFVFDLSRSVASSGVGGFVESDQLNASWTQALSERQTIGANLTWRASQSATTGDTRTFNLWSSRALDDFWSLRFSYLYKQREGGGLPEASGHVLGLALSYSHPDFLDL